LNSVFIVVLERPGRLSWSLCFLRGLFVFPGQIPQQIWDDFLKLNSGLIPRSDSVFIWSPPAAVATGDSNWQSATEAMFESVDPQNNMARPRNSRPAPSLTTKGAFRGNGTSHSANRARIPAQPRPNGRVLWCRRSGPISRAGQTWRLVLPLEHVQDAHGRLTNAPTLGRSTNLKRSVYWLQRLCLQVTRKNGGGVSRITNRRGAAPTSSCSFARVNMARIASSRSSKLS
jgi:hypothetical protein